MHKLCRRYQCHQSTTRITPIGLLLCLVTSLPLHAQGDRPHPLEGTNHVSVRGSLGYAGAGANDRAIPAVSESIVLGHVRGERRSVGLHLSRSMPDFFISRGLTAQVGIAFVRYRLEREGSGQVGQQHNVPSVRVEQRSTLTADVLALDLGIRINMVRDLSGLVPTFNLGATFGHLLDLDLVTETEPDIGFPSDGYLPDRRYFYGALNLGVGLGIPLGEEPGRAALIPTIGLSAAATSLTKNEGEELIPLSFTAGLEVRLPIGSSAGSR